MSQERELLLILCDISGYTRFMTANRETLLHSHAVIAELITAMVRQARAPLRVLKFEGDAVFLCAGLDKDPERIGRRVRERLDRIFAAFDQKRTELVAANRCPCPACTRIDRLRLKAVVHRGVGVFHRICRRDEVCGVDVILVHRLLKNSVGRDEYLLLTDAARSALGIPSTVPGDCGREEYEGLGSVPTFVCAPRLDPDALPAPPPGRCATFPDVAGNLLRIFGGCLRHFRLPAGAEAGRP